MAGGIEAQESHIPGTSSGVAATERAAVAQQVRLAKLDTQAFEALYRGHVDTVYRYCCRRLGSTDAAADATSQIFIKAYASLHTCDESRFRSWLFAIANNVLIDEYRSRRPQETLDAAGEMMSSELSPEESVLQDEERVTVVRLLSFLTHDQRQIVELRLAGLNGNEIAQVLGKSRGSVDTAQSRAISKLRRVLNQDRAQKTELEAPHVSA